MTVPGWRYWPDIDARNADDAGERRLESLLLDGRLNACETGAGRGEQSARLIEVGLRAVAAGRQGPGALEAAFGRLHGRLHVLDVGALDRVVELHQDLALANLLVGLELDLAHDARDLEGELHAVGGLGRADGADARRPGLRLDLGSRDRLRRRLHGREELRDHLVAEKVEPDQAGAQPDRKKEHETNNNTPFHRLFPRFRTHINGFI